MILSIDYAYPIIVPLIGTISIGFISGIIGTFAFLRGQSLVADAIAHAALPGIVIAFMLTHSTSVGALMVGGFCSGFIGIICFSLLRHYTRIKQDALLGIILSVFFGLGLVLLTVVQKMPMAQQSILNKFLFGCAATQLYADVQLLCIVIFFILTIILLCWKECILIIFDRAYARSIGYSVLLLECLIQTMLVTVIVIGLYTVGVTLMSSMLIAPCVAARQWTRQVHSMVIIAGVFGAVSGCVSVCISSYMQHIPIGPSMVIIASSITGISLYMRHT